MKTENGYVYFMYNPFTGLPDSDSDDFYDEDDERLAHKSNFFFLQHKLFYIHCSIQVTCIESSKLDVYLPLVKCQNIALCCDLNVMLFSSQRN